MWDGVGVLTQQPALKHENWHEPRLHGKARQVGFLLGVAVGVIVGELDAVALAV